MTSGEHYTPPQLEALTTDLDDLSQVRPDSEEEFSQLPPGDQDL